MQASLLHYFDFFDWLRHQNNRINCTEKLRKRTSSISEIEALVFPQPPSHFDLCNTLHV